MTKNISAFLMLCSFLPNIFIHSAVAINDYKMPFRYGETWKVSNNGIHPDVSLGLALDFVPVGISSLEVLAPASGTITRGCTDRDQTYLILDTGFGDMFSILHLQKDSVPFQKGIKQFVRKGDFLGKISTIAQPYTSTFGCTLISTGAHLHLGFTQNMCPLIIENTALNCSDGSNIGTEIRSTNLPENIYNNFKGNIGYKNNTSLVMTVVNSNPNSQTPVRLQTNIENLHQKWQYDPISRQIQGLNDKCIDGGDTNNSQNRWLRIDRCVSGQKNQQWFVDNKSRIRSLSNFNLCIELQYTTEYIYNLTLANCDDTEFQKFSLPAQTIKSQSTTKKAVRF